MIITSGRDTVMASCIQYVPNITGLNFTYSGHVKIHSLVHYVNENTFTVWSLKNKRMCKVHSFSNKRNVGEIKVETEC